MHALLALFELELQLRLPNPSLHLTRGCAATH
jgi:hypothetical protein